MIEVGVVDLSAESRRKLSALLERWSWSNSESPSVAFPKLSMRTLAPEEVRFNGGLDVCIVGPELISCDLAFVSKIRTALEGKILICILDSRTYSFGMIEQLGRLRVDDVLIDTASSDEFYRRLLLLTRTFAHQRSGSVVVVDAVRGGVGTTFIAAGLAEQCLTIGKRVCFVDTDVVTQDASRFLGVRPCVNEPLKIILEHQRVVTSETVKECVFQVWDEEPNFLCAPPAAATDESLFSDANVLRTFTSVIDTLRTLFDVVVIDAAPLTSVGRLAITQIATSNYLVIDRDPAGAYAARHALSRLIGCSQVEATITVVVNDTQRGSLSINALRESVLISGERDFNIVSIPYVARAGRWACSGATAAHALPAIFNQLVSSSVVSHPGRSGNLWRSWYLPVLNKVTQKFTRKSQVDRRKNQKLHQPHEGSVKARNEECMKTGLEFLDSPSTQELISRPTLTEFSSRHLYGERS